jgi:hypothetical protein
MENIDREIDDVRSAVGAYYSGAYLTRFHSEDAAGRHYVTRLHGPDGPTVATVVTPHGSISHVYRP